MRSNAIGALATALMLSSTGCGVLLPAKIHHEVDPTLQASAVCEAAEAALPGDRVVGVAISGGGSRAAVFGASVFEALSEHGFLGEISHLSTVSGGSFSGGYFMANPYPCDESATTQATQTCRDEYFADFKYQMRQQYFWWMIARDMLPWRLGSHTRRAQSLSEVLDNRFLHGRTFGELAPQPIWLANATNYDEARRFVFSNGCLPAGPPAPPADSNISSESRSRIMARMALSDRTLRALSFSLPGCTRPAPSDMSMSLAVATSAGFPPIGPVTLETPSECKGGEPQWWHLADGGIIENPGTDSLEEVLLRRLAGEGAPLQKALIISIDAGSRLDPEKLKQDKDYEMYMDTGRLGRLLDAPRERGQAYHDMFWNVLREALANEGIAYDTIKLQSGDAAVPELPKSCGGKVPRLKGDGWFADRVSYLQAITDSVVGIPTALSIEECDADLLEMMAHQLVHQTFDEAMLGHLSSQGYAIHANSDCALERHPK